MQQAFLTPGIEGVLALGLARFQLLQHGPLRRSTFELQRALALRRRSTLGLWQHPLGRRLTLRPDATLLAL